MIVTYWGVRGSLPVPGSSTVRYGGNTSCVAVRRGDSLLVLDAGTGIAALGEGLASDVREIVLLLTHRHMDHVQGLPFFRPLHDGSVAVVLLDLPVEEGFWTPLALFDGAAVPIPAPALDGRVRRCEGEPMDALRERGWEVQRIALRHPGGAAGFRIEEAGRSFVHCTDTELGSGDGAGDGDYFDRCVRFCRGADVLSHDAQYLADEVGARRGRGHSTVERACELAERAGVGRLILFHHDPARDDTMLDEIGRVARERLAARGIGCVVAREGLVLEV